MRKEIEKILIKIENEGISKGYPKFKPNSNEKLNVTMNFKTLKNNDLNKIDITEEEQKLLKKLKELGDKSEINEDEKKEGLDKLKKDKEELLSKMAEIADYIDSEEAIKEEIKIKEQELEQLNENLKLIKKTINILSEESGSDRKRKMIISLRKEILHTTMETIKIGFKIEELKRKSNDKKQKRENLQTPTMTPTYQQ